MSVAAVGDYQHASHDGATRFEHPLLYIGWDEHMMFAAPIVQMLPLNTPFDALIHKVLPKLYGEHPDFATIQWDKAQWFRGSTMVMPKRADTLADHGFGHKSVLRFRTPGLEGLRGSCG